MWFGTRNHEMWVPACVPDSSFTPVGWNTKKQLLNGGSRVRRSKVGHMEYVMEWNPDTRANLRPIMNFATGVYDDQDGTNLIYFYTPEAMDQNVAASSHGFPGHENSMSLVRGVLPEIVATDANTLGYPARSAYYTLGGTETARNIYYPIPPGYDLHIGFHGAASGDAGVQVIPYAGSVAGTAVELTPIAVTSTTRTNESFSSSSYTGVEVGLLVDEGTVTATAIIIQILPTGDTPQAGGYISGMGHSGCEFESTPSQTVYRIVKAPGQDRIGMAAKLTETGDWL
jgi:hypothetical protein